MICAWGVRYIDVLSGFFIHEWAKEGSDSEKFVEKAEELGISLVYTYDGDEIHAIGSFVFIRETDEEIQ